MLTVGNPIVLGLPDLCTDAFSLILQIARTKNPGDYDTLRHKVDDIFHALETRAKGEGVSEDDVKLAKYALVAFLDETVLMSNWPGKEKWAGRPLQLEYFNDYVAGEEFYNKLDSLRNTSDPKKLQVVEVYYTCLALGFRGKFGDLSGMDKLKLLMDGLAKELRRAKDKPPEGLAEHWKPPDELPQTVKNFPVWIVSVACGTILLLFFVILAALLSSRADDVIKFLEH